MSRLSIGLLLLVIAGCSSPSQRNAATMDEVLGTSSPVAGNSVSVSGQVRRTVIPWNETLTLRQAFILSGYFGPSSGMQLGVHRGKEMPMYIDMQNLYHGQDMLLEPGDRIEIQPIPK